MFSISILIPTYNWNILPLVKCVYDELKDENINFEIIAMDDASFSANNLENEKINTFNNCKFLALESNIGRSSLRNLMAQKAGNEYLLFLDCDVMPVNIDFIKKYALEGRKYDVSVGGIAYEDKKNKELLRWKIGRSNEQKTVEERNKLPYKYLLTGNFMIKKIVFSTVKFDESLTKYGYEDLLFAKHIETKKIKVRHINNPVYHLGIDENEQFLVKTKEALTNLGNLIHKDKLSFKDTRITELFKKIQPYKLPKLLAFFLPFLKKQAFGRSSLLFYNLFRLAYLSKVMKNIK